MEHDAGGGEGSAGDGARRPSRATTRGRRRIEQLAERSPRELSAEAKYAILHSRRSSGEKVTVGVPLDMNVYTADGTYITILFRVFQAEEEADLLRS